MSMKRKITIDDNLTPSQKSKIDILRKSDVFFINDFSELEEDENENLSRAINLNDSMYWACSDSEMVNDEDIDEVYALYSNYGWNGILYWASKRSNRSRPEFENVKRAIDFIEQEENILNSCKRSSEHAYKKVKYTLGGSEIVVENETVPSQRSKLWDRIKKISIDLIPYALGFGIGMAITSQW